MKTNCHKSSGIGRVTEPIAAIGLFLIGTTPLHSQSYTITYLGTNSHANAINNSGRVVGNTAVSGGSWHATLFSGTGSNNTDLGTLGGDYSAAYDINNSGQIVGVSTLVGSNVNRAILFGGTGSGNIDLGTLGGTESQAYGINDSGKIVGEAHTASGVAHATLFGGNGSDNADLGTLGGSTSRAYAVNNSNQIVGEANTTGEVTRPTLFSVTSGSKIDLGTIGGSSGRAYGINDAGQIVGSSSIPGDFVTYTMVDLTGNTTTIQVPSAHATLFTGPGNLDLASITDTNSTAVAINSSGQVIGTSFPAGFISFYSGGILLNAESSVPAHIRDLIPSGTAVNDVSISQGRVINDWGQIVANTEINIGINTTYFVPFALRLDPINPNTTTSFGITNTKFVAGMSYDKFSATTNLGGLGTTVDLLDGTAGSGGNGTYGQNRDVNVSFHNAESALASDIVDLSGTAGIGFSDIFVLQLTYDEATAIALFGTEYAARLGWFDPDTGTCKLAITGNTGGIAFFAGDHAYNSATDFNLGTYGVDTANNTVWAVLNHNSEFATVPEPSTWALLLGGAAVVFAFRRRGKVE